jgi:hypothetical protein
VHVRLAPRSGGPRLKIATGRRSRSILLLALGGCWLAGACHRPATARGLTFDWSLTPSLPAVGPATLTLLVHDDARRPVHGAQFRVEAAMSHPGMAPVLAPVTERGHGVYEAALRFTMAGDWILLVAGTLANGETVQYRIDVPHVRSTS